MRFRVVLNSRKSIRCVGVAAELIAVEVAEAIQGPGILRIQLNRPAIGRFGF